jgi:RNA polymerase sigma-70 factor, ECF subfamily
MTPDSALPALLAGLGEAHRREADASAEVRDALVARMREAHDAWPRLVEDDLGFAAHLGARLEGNRPLCDSLAAVRAGDLYLAWACTLGRPAALAEFEKGYLRELDAAWRTVIPAPVPLEEARQRFREKLFVARGEDEPAIGGYAGRGGLRPWLRVAAARMLLDLAKRPRQEVSAEDEFFETLPWLGADPQAQLDKRTHRAELKAALAEAIAALSTRERNVLRYAFIEALTIDQIGAIYGVHRATAARRVADARSTLRTLLRERLAERLGASDRELDAILGLVESQLDLSLERLLAPPRRP